MINVPLYTAFGGKSMRGAMGSALAASALLRWCQFAWCRKKRVSENVEAGFTEKAMGAPNTMSREGSCVGTEGASAVGTYLPAPQTTLQGCPAQRRAGKR